eukprot:CFRG7667T1
MEQSTVAQLQDRIKAILDSYSVSSQDNGKTTEGALHPYGKLNFAADKNEFLKTTELLKKTLSRFLRICQITPQPQKFLVALKDKVFAEKTIEKLKVSVSACKSLIDEGKGRPTVITSTEILNRLQAVSKVYRLQFHPDTSAPPIISVFINTDMFYVEIEIETESPKKAAVKKVTIAHTADDEKIPDVNQHLSLALRQGDFGALNKRLAVLTSFYDICDDDISKRSLLGVWRAFHEDVKTICDAESEWLSQRVLTSRERLGLLHGVLKGGVEDEQLMELYYFVCPREVTKIQCVLNTATETVGKGAGTQDLLTELVLRKSHRLTLSMQRHFPVELCQASTVIVDPITSSMTVKAPSECQPVQLSAAFVMLLSEGVPASESLVCKIEEVLGVKLLRRFRDNSKAVRHVNLDQLLIREDAALPENCQPTKRDNKYYRSKLGQQHIYCMALSKSHPGYLLHRIPFTRVEQILPCIELLRQQITFNTLFKSLVTQSVAKSRDGNVTSRSEDCKTTLLHQIPSTSIPAQHEMSTYSLMFDVSTPLPFLIVLSCRHPFAPTVFSVRIKVGKSGRISVKKELPKRFADGNDDSNCQLPSDAVLTHELEEHLCIPSAIAIIYKVAKSKLSSSTPKPIFSASAYTHRSTMSTSTSIGSDLASQTNDVRFLPNDVNSHMVGVGADPARGTPLVDSSISLPTDNVSNTSSVAALDIAPSNDDRKHVYKDDFGRRSMECTDINSHNAVVEENTNNTSNTRQSRDRGKTDTDFTETSEDVTLLNTCTVTTDTAVASEIVGTSNREVKEPEAIDGDEGGCGSGCEKAELSHQSKRSARLSTGDCKQENGTLQTTGENKLRRRSTRGCGLSGPTENCKRKREESEDSDSSSTSSAKRRTRNSNH